MYVVELHVQLAEASAALAKKLPADFDTRCGECVWYRDAYTAGSSDCCHHDVMGTSDQG